MAPTDSGAIFCMSASHSSNALGPPNRPRISWKGSGPIVASKEPGAHTAVTAGYL